MKSIRNKLINNKLLDFSTPPTEDDKIKFHTKADGSRILNRVNPTKNAIAKINPIIAKVHDSFSTQPETVISNIQYTLAEHSKRDTSRTDLLYKVNANGSITLSETAEKIFPEITRKEIEKLIQALCEMSFAAIFKENGEYKKDFEQYAIKHFGVNALSNTSDFRRQLLNSASQGLTVAFISEFSRKSLLESTPEQPDPGLTVSGKSGILMGMLTQSLLPVLKPYMEYKEKQIFNNLLNQYETAIQKQKKIIATEEAKGETTEQAKKNLRLVQARITLEKLKETYEPFRLNKFVEMSELNEVLSNGLKVAALRTACVNYKIHLEKKYKNEDIGGVTPTSQKGDVVDELIENLNFKSASATQQLDNFSQTFVAKFIPLMKDLDRTDKKFVQALRQQSPAIDTVFRNKEELALLKKEYYLLLTEQNKIIVEELKTIAMNLSCIDTEQGQFKEALKNLKEGKNLSDWTSWDFARLKESIDNHAHEIKSNVRLYTALEVNAILDGHRFHYNKNLSDVEKIQSLSDYLTVAKLHNECRIYKSYLENLKSSLPYKDPLAAETRTKLAEMNKLMSALAAGQSNKAKIDNFTLDFYNSASILAFNPDKPSIQFLKTVKRILTAIVTLGYYPYAKAKQTGSFKFWKSPEQIHFEKMQRVVSPDAPSGKSKGPKSQSQ